MIPWIQVYSNLIKHPKTYALADELKLTSKDASPNVVAAGMLVSLWLWAAQNATDGDLSKCPPRAIAEAAEYRKNPVTFVAALKRTRWLDNDGKLHDWGEYATLLIECDQQQREKTRKRVERHRAKKKTSGNVADTQSNAYCNVTDTPCNAPTIPNHTIPNNTIPDNTGGYKPNSTYTPTAAPAPAIKEGPSFTVFWEAYPNKADRSDAWEAWKALNPDAETVSKIREGLDAWKRSGQWLDDGGRFIPSAAKWLTKRRWECPPAPLSYMKGGQRQLDADDIAAIHRIMSEPIDDIPPMEGEI